MTKDAKKLISDADIRELKLINNTAIIAEVLAEDDDTYLLYEPLEIISDLTTASFVPWFTTHENGYINIEKNKTITDAVCTFEIKKMYMQAVMKQNVKNALEEMDKESNLYDFFNKHDTEGSFH